MTTSRRLPVDQLLHRADLKGIVDYALPPLREQADIALLQSLSYLLDVAADGGIDTEVAGLAVAEATATRKSTPGSRVRALAFELHHLLLVALRAQNKALATKRAGFLESARLVSSEPASILALDPGSLEDGIFIDLILPEYSATSPTVPTLRAPNANRFANSVRSTSKAIELLHSADEQYSTEFDLLVDRITILSSPTVKAGTSIRSYGRIWMEQSDLRDDWLAPLEMLVHEIAHLHLYLLQLNDPMVMNGADEGFASPFRPDPRPMSGIYHAMFVLARSIEFFANVGALAEKGALHVDPSKVGELRTLESRFRANFRDIDSVITKYAEMSPTGAATFARCREVALSE